MENENAPMTDRKTFTKLVTEIIETFGGRPDPTYKESRFPLRGCRGIVNAPNQQKRLLEVDFADLSFMGAGFVSYDPLEVGEVIDIGFGPVTLVSQRLWPAEVVRVQLRENGLHLVGVRFLWAPEES